MEKDKVVRNGDLASSIAGLGLATMMSGALFGGLNKMFGMDEKIPKGVVRELMQGVMDGLIDHFQYQIDELKRDNEKLELKIQHLEPWERRYKELLEVCEKERAEKESKKKGKAKPKGEFGIGVKMP